MSFTPKTWQDYQPNSLTNTPITAAELNRIETGITGAYDNMALYVKDPFFSMFPEYTYNGVNVTITSGSTLLDTPPTFKIPASQFDPTRDGIMIWVNTVTPVYSIYYSFSTATISGTDYVVITFEQSQSALFTVGAQVLFMLFAKPPDSGGSRTYGTSAIYSPLASVSSTIGSGFTDLSPNLKSPNDANENARSSINIGRLCTNLGGVAVVFVMHRCDVTISDGTGATWQHISVSHSAQAEDAAYQYHSLSVYWRQIPENTPINITVSAESTYRLWAMAAVYEGKTTVSLVESSNDVTYTTLYYDTSQSMDGFVSSPTTGGIDVFAIGSEASNNVWNYVYDTDYDPSDPNTSHPETPTDTTRMAEYPAGTSNAGRTKFFANENGLCKDYVGFYVVPIPNYVTMFLHVYIV